ncbi:nickel-dependent hydrogenase large subunit [bacterium]|nr:nickel-dependent hydrogenase large subunit [bacterium]
MTVKKIVNIPLNRVEGDLEISVEIEDGVATEARCSGTMYRGFEKILLGRGALDGLVITPRICGICNTGHLTTASLALDVIANVTPPPDATRIRNIALMTEMIQSDMRHGFLMFTADFVNPAYEKLELYDEAVQRFEPLKGQALFEVIRETKKILEIVAILGGQWPHSSYMVPGGIVSLPNQSDLVKCRLLLEQYQSWYEQRILGCSLDRWLEVKSGKDLELWLEENDSHRQSHLGFFIRYARLIGLDKIGKGCGNYISFGAFDLPDGTSLNVKKGQTRFVPSGFASSEGVDEFDQGKITEHVEYSWFEGDKTDLHPARGETKPYASGYEGKKYSWAKAPRYDGRPAETGPLAEMIIGKNPLFTDLLKTNGSSVFSRELARLVRPAQLIPAMNIWLSETVADGKFYNPPGEIINGEGFGLTQVTRGALGHWVRIENRKIAHYQIISPTTWNLSPRDADGIRGPGEEALIGTEISDIANPVKLGHIVRSFDACLVCTVHAIDKRTKRMGRIA